MQNSIYALDDDDSGPEYVYEATQMTANIQSTYSSVVNSIIQIKFAGVRKIIRVNFNNHGTY